MFNIGSLVPGCVDTVGPRVPRPSTLLYTFLIGLFVPSALRPFVPTTSSRRPIVPSSLFYIFVLHICFGRTRLTSYFSSSSLCCSLVPNLIDLSQYHFRLQYIFSLGVINFLNSDISQHARIRLNILANEQ